MSDRLFSLFLLLLASLYGVYGLQLEIPFSYDPLGPKPVPLFLSAVLFLLSVIILLRPLQIDPETKRTPRRPLWLFSILLFYQITWLPLGFLLSTTISCYLLSRQFHCSWMQGLMGAMIVTVLCYGFFNLILHIPLPLGYIFSYTRG